MNPETLIVGARDQSWTPQQGTVLGKTTCSLDLGGQESIYFFAVQGTNVQQLYQDPSVILAQSPHQATARSGT